jgi:uroporphyrin-III C-methyltransferase
MITPKLTLVGAGPGDVELISVKGLKALQTADVVLYDALVNIELLEFAPANALRIFVGKRKGFKEFEQEEINQLNVDYALQYGQVVRLKGGDSFVFGRGFEEIQFAQAFGIETELIPGISSSISVPALAGIPVTHRGASNSFWVLTATLADGSLNPEIAKVATTLATVVILMGLGKLIEIANVYSLNDKGETAVAVISKGSTPDQKTVVGTIETIYERVAESQIKSPAVIVIGEVVRLNREFEMEVATKVQFI